MHAYHTHTHTCTHKGPTKADQAVIDWNYQGLSTVLSDAAFDTENVDALMKLKVFFDSCMNTEEINRRGVQPLLDLLNQTGTQMLARGDGYFVSLLCYCGC